MFIALALVLLKQEKNGKQNQTANINGSMIEIKKEHIGRLNMVDFSLNLMWNLSLCGKKQKIKELFEMLEIYRKRSCQKMIGVVYCSLIYMAQSPSYLPLSLDFWIFALWTFSGTKKIASRTQYSS